MKVLMVFLFPFILLATCPEQENFDEVDLRSQLGPLRHQDGVGWCASFSSADLLTDWLNRHKSELGMESIDFTQEENMVSAAAVALAFNNLGRREGSRLEVYQDELLRARLDEERLLISSQVKDLRRRNLQESTEFQELSTRLTEINEQIEGLQPYSEPHGGVISKVIREVSAIGLYYEAEVSSQDYSFSNLEEITQQIYDLYSPQQDCLDSDICSAAQMMSQVFPTLDLSEVFSILEHGFSEGVDPFQRLLDSSGPDIVFTGSLRPEMVPCSGKGNARIECLLSGLHQGKVVGISYGANILLKDPVTRDQHASSIVGVRYSCLHQEPVYILRNSWGELSCQRDYEDIFERKVTEIGAEQAEREMPFSCDDGYYLVPQSILESTLGDIQTLN